MTHKKQPETPKRDTYQTLTDAILEKLESCGPFERPWKLEGAPPGLPTNAATGRTYRGTNVVMLWLAASEKGYATGRWATFKQWMDKGAKVRKGEKGTPVLWFNLLERKKQGAPDDEGPERIPCARLSWVFNAAQVDGDAPPAVLQLPTRDPVAPIARADALIAASGARVIHGGAQAFYRPATDTIHMPPREVVGAERTRRPGSEWRRLPGRVRERARGVSADTRVLASADRDSEARRRARGVSTSPRTRRAPIEPRSAPRWGPLGGASAEFDFVYVTATGQVSPTRAPPWTPPPPLVGTSRN